MPSGKLQQKDCLGIKRTFSLVLDLRKKNTVTWSLFFVCFSKKILTLGLKGDPPPHPKAVQLQRMIRYSATLFVQVGQQITHSFRLLIETDKKDAILAGFKTIKV